MKRYIILWIAVLCAAGRLEAQTTGANWVKTKTTISDTGTAITDITYYNGLGLPSQNVSVGATVNTYDWVTPIEYDAMLRSDAKQHLPYEATNEDGRENYNAISDQQTFYEERYGMNYSRAFTETVYEASPLNRIRKQALPGYMNYDVRYSTIGYLANGPGDVRKLSVNSSGMLVNEGYYAAGTLSCTETTDADGHIVRVFTDGRGLTLLKRSVNGPEQLDTYSVYDDYSRLRWVVSPEGSKQIGSESYASTSVFAGNYCYVYLYDERGRVVEKQLPGCGREYLVYDTGDRVVMSQDGNLRTRQQWMTSHYDALERLRAQYIVTDSGSSTRPSLQGVFDNGQTPILYMDLSGQLMRQYVYDAYPEAISGTDLDFELIEGLTGTEGTSLRYNNPQGALTYEKLTVLSDGQVEGYLQRTYYYDYKNRPIQHVELDSEGGVLRTSTLYDFVGNILTQRERYRLGTTDDRTDRDYDYGHYNRLMGEITSVNGAASGAIVQYEYDDRGQNCGKTYHAGSTGLSETLEYNIQGWLTNRSSDLFSMRLNYYDPWQPGSVPSYTGNISEWEWTHTGTDLATPQTNTYAFTYDNVNRLTSTKQYIDGVASEQFVEKGLTYDYNGNIQTLQRSALGTSSENFTYAYSGNQLTTLSGTTAGSYTYDANGNMTHDGPNNLDLSYNHLNLTEKVTQNSSTVAKYSYLSDGTKLAAVNADGNGLIYRGSLVYKKQGNDLMLESVGFNGGRLVTAVIQGRKFYVPNYYLTDHLGSVRVIVDGTGKVQERNDFYPFGMRWDGASSLRSSNRYRYNGKEEQGFLGLPYTDYGARQYDPKYRLEWNGMDKLAEMTPGITPFAFCNNNPTRFVDHFGLSAQDTIDVNHIEPVVITATRSTSTLNSLAYYMLPMVSFNDAAEQAAADRRWGAYAGNLVLGGLEGVAFYATLGQSNRFVGYLKMSAATAKIAKATSKIDRFIAAAGKLERKTDGVRQAVIKGGNIEKTFSSLIEGGVKIGEKRFRLPDGTFLTKYNSSTNGVGTIWIHRPDGKMYKIRFE